MRFLARGLLGILLLAVMISAAGYGIFRVSSSLTEVEARRKPPVSERIYPVNVLDLQPQAVSPDHGLWRYPQLAQSGNPDQLRGKAGGGGGQVSRWGRCCRR